MDDGASSDWRSDLLQAVSYVFTKERESLLSELRSHALAHGHGSKKSDIIQAIEDKINQLVSTSFFILFSMFHKSGGVL